MLANFDAPARDECAAAARRHQHAAAGADAAERSRPSSRPPASSPHVLACGSRSDDGQDRLPSRVPHRPGPRTRCAAGARVPAPPSSQRSATTIAPAPDEAAEAARTSGYASAGRTRPRPNSPPGPASPRHPQPRTKRSPAIDNERGRATEHELRDSMEGQVPPCPPCSSNPSRRARRTVPLHQSRSVTLTKPERSGSNSIL